MNKSFETLWSKEERYLINKMRSEYLQKLENNQPERLNPKDIKYFGMKAEVKDGLCYFEDGTIIDLSQEIDVCDSPNSDNK